PGIRAATSFSPSALQARSKIVSSSVPEPFAEDCLYLNIYTPAADNAHRPVMFWIHGGGFSFGAGGELLYDGGRLAERGNIVVVTINYRLGALGFSHFPTPVREKLGLSSNAGCLDQIAALHWVRDNIAAFGGDPNAVTIAGESAGAFSVGMLLAMPAARGLYRYAIAQSGARFSRGHGDPHRSTEALMRELAIPAETPEALWDVPAERVLEAQQALAAGAQISEGTVSPFVPVHDGDTLPLPLEHAIASGHYANVPLLIGTNRDEINLFLGPLLRKLSEPISEDALSAGLTKLVPDASRERLAALVEVYGASRKQRDLPHGPRAILAAISSDALWRIPSERFAEAHLVHQPATYQYLFTYESPAMRGALRACHGLELPFMFGTLDMPGQPEFAGRGEAQQQLSERMMDVWLALCARVIRACQSRADRGRRTSFAHGQLCNSTAKLRCSTRLMKKSVLLGTVCVRERSNSAQRFAIEAHADFKTRVTICVRERS
ncbi:MAG TPA: carboxylesterase family protein, partial [Polyangiales bacterium]|nr:carboxylesterase family protein [Polyangiales bacterium]